VNSWNLGCIVWYLCNPHEEEVVLFSPEIALIVFTQPCLSAFTGCRWVLQPLFRKQWQAVGLSLSSSSFFLWYGLSLLLDEMRFIIVYPSFSCCFSFVGMWGKTLNCVCTCGSVSFSSSDSSLGYIVTWHLV
jgi:hypothetical protein